MKISIRNQIDPQRSPALVIGVLGVCGVLMLSPLYGTIPLIAPIASTFHSTHASVGLISFAFGFAYALACVLFGPLSDVRGRRSILIAGVIAEGVIGLLTAASPSLPVLIAARIVQGYAAGTFGPVAIGYVAETYSGPLRHAGIAILSTGLISAGSVGQIVAQLISDISDWRVFFIVIGVAEIVVGMLLLAILRDAQIDRSGRSLRRTYEAEGGLLKTAPIRSTYLVGFVIYLGFVLYYMILGPHVVGTLRASAATIFTIRAIALPGMLLTIVAGPLIDRLGPRRVVTAGLALEVVGLLLTLAGKMDVGRLSFASAVFSCGFAFAAVSMNALVTELGGVVRGAAMAFFVFCSFTGASLAPFVAEGLAPFGFSATIAELTQATAVACLFIVLAVPRDLAADDFVHTSGGSP